MAAHTTRWSGERSIDAVLTHGRYGDLRVAIGTNAAS